MYITHTHNMKKQIFLMKIPFFLSFQTIGYKAPAQPRALKTSVREATWWRPELVFDILSLCDFCFELEMLPKKLAWIFQKARVPKFNR